MITGTTVRPHGLRELLEEAASLAGAFLARCDDPNERVTTNPSPELIRSRIGLALPRDGHPHEQVMRDLRSVLDLSVLTGHTGFSNQLYSGYDPVAIVGEWMTAVLNTSMYTYEVAPVLTLIEYEVVRRLCAAVGWSESEGEGTFTPGGSISNLMAMLVARHRARPEIKSRGVGGKPLVCFVSEEAHYSVQRAAAILGTGLDSVVAVPADKDGRMDVASLRRAIAESRAAGAEPFMVVATAGTTVLGAFDPIDSIADICEQERVWFHVDGAFGGSALLSGSRRGLLGGAHRADSVTWCPHKMMGVPLVCSVLLVKDRGRLADCCAVKAEYLFHAGDGDACLDLGEMSLQCGRRVDALKLWLAWRAQGDAGYAARIDALFDIAAEFRSLIRSRPSFRLFHDPDPLGGSCNTCFHYLPRHLRGVEITPTVLRELHEATAPLREAVKARGKYMTNYAPVRGVSVFRHVSVNPLVTSADLSGLLAEIEECAAAR